MHTSNTQVLKYSKTPMISYMYTSNSKLKTQVYQGYHMHAYLKFFALLLLWKCPSCTLLLLLLLKHINSLIANSFSSSSCTLQHILTVLRWDIKSYSSSCTLKQSLPYLIKSNLIRFYIFFLIWSRLLCMWLHNRAFDCSESSRFSSLASPDHRMPRIKPSQKYIF